MPIISVAVGYWGATWQMPDSPVARRLRVVFIGVALAALLLAVES